MTISRAKPANWALNEKLTSTQMNTVDTNAAKALDKTSAGDTLSGKIALSGIGRIILTCIDAPDADTTVQVGDARIFRLTDPTVAHEYVLGTTGVSQGDTLSFWADPLYEYTATIKFGGVTLWKVGNWNQGQNQSAWATFIYLGSSWYVLSTDRPNGFMSFGFTGNGTWTSPPNTAMCLAYGWGGGCGGGGGAPGDTAILKWASGGGGGGGSLSHLVPFIAIPGRAHDIVIGAGGAGGLPGGDGSSGTATTITDSVSSVLRLSLPASTPGRAGGIMSNDVGGGSTQTRLAPGGRPIDGGYWPTVILTLGAFDVLGHGPGFGGEGTVAHDGVATPVRDGHGSAEGYAGGTSGTRGTYSGETYRAGGGGGGGGGGPGGAGGNGGNGGNGSNAAGNNGSDGASAGANTGAGGGGGGGGGSGSSGGSPGVGGQGGTGKLTIICV